MLTVYKVDDRIRLHLPDDDWSRTALARIEAAGHKVEATAETVDDHKRSEEEAAEAVALLSVMDE